MILLFQERGGDASLDFLKNLATFRRDSAISPGPLGRNYRLCLSIRAMDNSSNLLIVQNLDSTERIGISHSLNFLVNRSGYLDNRSIFKFFYVI